VQELFKECCDYEQFAEWWKNLEKWHQPTTEVFNLTELVKLMTPLRFPIPVIIFCGDAIAFYHDELRTAIRR
jgi:hypothetical protein